MKKVYDKEELARYWQKILGLEDWKIKFIFNCRPEDLPDDCCGSASIKESIKLAVIRVVDPQFYPEDSIGEFNLKKTLIHELLHIKFILIDESGNKLQDRLVHQIVDDLARAFERDGRNRGQ